MLPGGDSLTVRPVTPVTASPAIAALGDTQGELYQRALQRLIGQQLTGEVLSKFTDGSFMVKVGDTAARMMLPGGSKVGDQFPLRLITLEPRPTFAIGNDATQAAVVALSRSAQDDLELRQPAAAGTPEASDTEDGQTKHGAAAATGAAQQQALPMQPNQRLAQKFVQIGAMYRPEYDVAPGNSDDGVNPPMIGKDGALIAQFERLPQNSAGPPQHSPANFSTAGKLINQLLQVAQRNGAPLALEGQTAILPEPGEQAQQVAQALRNTINHSGLFYESHVAEWADGRRPLSDLMLEPQMQAQENSKESRPDQNRLEFAQLVNLQLNTLEQQRTHWRGEIWPGQHMDWEVSKEQDRPQSEHGGGAGEPPENWQSVVRFELPALGSIAASLHLIGGRVHIQLQTGDDTTASMLRAHADSLAEALGAAGSPLDSLTVTGNGQ